MKPLQFTTEEINHIRCPYCKDSNAIYHGNGSEIVDCEKCDNSYLVEKSIPRTKYVSTPDCELNGKEHTWEEWRGVAEFCTVCNKKKED